MAESWCDWLPALSSQECCEAFTCNGHMCGVGLIDKPRMANISCGADVCTDSECCNELTCNGHMCGVGLIDKPGMANISCGADVCTDSECCNELTCNGHMCGVGLIDKPGMANISCGADVCTDSECCNELTCSGHMCGVGLIDKPGMANISCGADVCTDSECCNELTCNGHMCGVGLIDKPGMVNISCGANVCTDSECCNELTCNGHMCGVGLIDKPGMVNISCGANVCTDSECCKELTCNGYVCGAGLTAKPGMDNISCGADVCTDSECCDQALCSATFCSDLGWADNTEWPKVAGKQGLIGVCGMPDSSCEGRKSHVEAEVFCKNKGARLCTANELMKCEAAGTGCNYDLEQVWTSTPCEGGFMTVRAGSLCNTPQSTCTTSDSAYSGRCCADADASSCKAPCANSSSSISSDYRKYSGLHCSSSAPDLATGFAGTAAECSQKASTLNASGFVRINSGSQFAGQCHFLGGTVEVSAAYTHDSRDCYKLQATKYVERCLVADEGAQVEVFFDTDVEACKRECASLRSCNSFSFNADDRVCLLQDNVVTPGTPTTSNVSKLDVWRTFYKACPPGFSYSHSGYWDNASEVSAPYGKVNASAGSTLFECAKICDSIENCTAFSFANASSCWVYAVLGSEREATSSTACTKDTGTGGTQWNLAASPELRVEEVLVREFDWDDAIIPLICVSAVAALCCMCLLLWMCYNRKRPTEKMPAERPVYSNFIVKPAVLPPGTFPNFHCQTTEGDFMFHDYLNRPGFEWTMLFSYRQDFVPVCTTEVGSCHVLLSEFQKRGVQLIGLSCDSLANHKTWTKDVLAAQNLDPRGALGFPLIADERRKISECLDILDHSDVAIGQLPRPVRALYLIGPGKRSHFSVFYPAGTGRNFSEVLRVLDSLYLRRFCDVGTPSGWQPGESVVPNCQLSASVARNSEDASGWWDPSLLRKSAQNSQPAQQPDVMGTDAPAQLTGELGRLKLGVRVPDSYSTDQVFRHRGQWTVLICWPGDLSPVATNELAGCRQSLADFEDRNVNFVGLTASSLERQRLCAKAAMTSLGNVHADLGFPLIADERMQLLRELGLFRPESPTRGIFVFGPDQSLQLSLLYPSTTGCNFSEILRALDSLMLSFEFRLATPANWWKGEPILLEPGIDIEQARANYDNFSVSVLPSRQDYLKWAACPNPIHHAVQSRRQESPSPLRPQTLDVWYDSFDRPDFCVEMPPPPSSSPLQSLLGKSENLWF
eukprot:TRINITY_DN8206_c0_g2_i2.p1 TRINITY_DN8206_c0_g2~~TRINITY_DN8206_c0_g2_i2.p1  ORF type:complete len:1356 (-),score=146.25 TRINITY_DN8206_c0_g2_i2:19-3720(-)